MRLCRIRVGYQLKQQKRLAKVKRQDAEYVESLGDSRMLSLSKPRFNARRACKNH